MNIQADHMLSSQLLLNNGASWNVVVAMMLSLQSFTWWELYENTYYFEIDPKMLKYEYLGQLGDIQFTSIMKYQIVNIEELKWDSYEYMEINITWNLYYIGLSTNLIGFIMRCCRLTWQAQKGQSAPVLWVCVLKSLLLSIVDF